ncbi:DNA repair protein RecO [Candidatus Saccharibacteria bacterium]|nr:DNA repair protein RecO [Candidatus Saccharibacteria bacterium]
MQKNTQSRDLRTLAYVLKRTNYGEADRILNLITPEGKVSAIAKGARKEKSKLAGGIEMFSLIDVGLHFGKSEFAIVTSAKMVKYYSNILKDFARMEFAGVALKKISLAADSSDNPEFFKIVDQVLYELDGSLDLRIVRSWFVLHLFRAMGGEINLYRDKDGARLDEGTKYNWDSNQELFYESLDGLYNSEDIKALRLMAMADLKLVKKIRMSEAVVGQVADFAQMFANI